MDIKVATFTVSEKSSNIIAIRGLMVWEVNLSVKTHGRLLAWKVIWGEIAIRGLLA